MDAVRLYDKLAYQLDAKDFAKTLNETAKRSRKAANQILSEVKVNRAVTAKDVIKTGHDVFDTSGKLTEKGSRDALDNIRKAFHLKTDEEAKKITVKQLIKKMVKIAESQHKVLNTEA